TSRSASSGPRAKARRLPRSGCNSVGRWGTMRPERGRGEWGSMGSEGVQVFRCSGVRVRTTHSFSTARLILTVLLCCGGYLCPRAALATSPTLRPEGEFPATVQAGRPYVIRIVYTDPKNDRPRDVVLVAEGPSGTQHLQPTLPRTGDFRLGVVVEW